MRDKELNAAILGVRFPWQVTSVILDPNAEEVRVLIEAVADTRFPCRSASSRVRAITRAAARSAT